MIGWSDVSLIKNLLIILGIMSGQHYCLRWNNYQSNMTSVFHQLLQNEAFVDVTLACNDLSLKAHKVSNKQILKKINTKKRNIKFCL